MSQNNRYNSQLDFFMATDMYNLPLPVLPPADLSILSTAFAPSFLFYRTGSSTKVVGFNPLDNAYIRGLGLQSNLADGLVASASGQNSSTGWQVILSSFVYDTVSLAISNTAGSDQITGAAGDFEKYLNVGANVMWLDDNKVVRTGVVASVAAGGASLTLSSVSKSGAATMFSGNTTNKKIFVQTKQCGGTIDFPFLTMNTLNPYSFFAWQASKVYAKSGTVSVTSGSDALVGVGTSFTDDYEAGDVIGYLDVSGIRRTGIVSTVTDDTNLTLTANALSTVSNAAQIDVNEFVGIKAEMGNDFTAYTITIDPAFGNGTRRLSISLFAEIEHTLALVGAI